MESCPLAHWLLLHYKIPSEPSASRVYIWRKLKRLGAYLLQDSVWVLPDTPRTLEQFQWLSAEIVEIGGEATFWRAQPALAGQDEGLVEQFTAQVEAAYHVLSQALDGPGADLESLSQQYRRIKSRDYFNSGAGQRLRAALIAARGVEK
jgi:hypothetical protein